MHLVPFIHSRNQKSTPGDDSVLRGLYHLERAFHGFIQMGKLAYRILIVNLKINGCGIQFIVFGRFGFDVKIIAVAQILHDVDTMLDLLGLANKHIIVVVLLVAVAVGVNGKLCTGKPSAWFLGIHLVDFQSASDEVVFHEDFYDLSVGSMINGTTPRLTLTEHGECSFSLAASGGEGTYCTEDDGVVLDTTHYEGKHQTHVLERFSAPDGTDRLKMTIFENTYAYWMKVS